MTPGGFRRGGVYVVAGGHGGLGRGLSLELARRYGARVAWLGRRAEDAEIAAGLAELGAAGGEGAYFQADLTREDAVAAAFAAVRARWGRVDGVVHSALVLRDRSFDRMREEDLLAALGPKVEGFAVLAREAHRAGAGWLLVFSSVVSLYHGPGQANYNAGSTFTDEYARWAEATYGLPVRVINWGFWGEVGVVATSRHRREMAARGLGSIGVAEGFAVVERVLAGPAPQVAYLKASPALLEELRVSPPPRTASRASSASSGLDALDAYARALLAARLRAQGLDARLTPADLAPAGEVASRLADALLPAAREALAAAPGDLAVLRRILLENHPDHAGHADLLAPCVAALPDVLAGRVRGTDVLFPGGSLALVRRVYEGSTLADAANRALAEAVVAAVRARRAAGGAGPVRILEFGAGTGATTAVVAAALERLGGPVEYLFTDVSAGFRRQFETGLAARHPGMRFAVADLDAPLSAQPPRPARSMWWWRLTPCTWPAGSMTPSA